MVSGEPPQEGDHMSRAQTILKEAKTRIRLTISDLETIEKSVDRDAAKNASFLLDYYHESEKGKKDVQHFLDLASKAAEKALKILKAPSYEVKQLKRTLLSWTDIPMKVEDFFPVPIYVSVVGDPMTVGILVHVNGKLEVFEGNDEASDKTYALVNKLLGRSQQITVWGMHGNDVVEKIRKSNTLPKGLYVSPSRKYAAGFFSLKGDRTLFSCVVDSSNLRQESEIDWKVIDNVKVKKFRTY